MDKLIMDRLVISVQELAAQMGISLPKAYELVKEPGFPLIHVGTRILVPIEPFKAWLAEESEKEQVRKQGKTE